MLQGIFVERLSSECKCIQELVEIKLKKKKKKMDQNIGKTWKIIKIDKKNLSIFIIHKHSSYNSGSIYFEFYNLLGNSDHEMMQKNGFTHILSMQGF